MVPVFLRSLNWALRAATVLFFTVVALGLAAIFALMATSLFTQDPGSPWLQSLIHSDGFFPWPVAAIFSLATYAPALVGIGIAGAVLRTMLRRLLLAQRDQEVGETIAVRETGVRFNGRPQMAIRIRLTLAGRQRDVTVHATPDAGNMPRQGDNVRVMVSRIDPTYVAYAGLA